MESQSPQPGIEPRSQQWKAWILTTSQPRNSHISFSLPSKETYMVKTSKMAVLLLSVHPLPDQCLLHHSNRGPSYLLAPGPNWWLFLAKGQWGVCPLLVSLVTNEPNSPVTGNLPFPSGVKVAPGPLLPIFCRTPWGTASGPCFRHVSSRILKPLAFLLLTLRSFFSLEAGQIQAL